ncbi:MAG: putative HTH-type transcriptional regulator [Mycobacterium sp.]|jgi:AcrR family transcriptional regulator|nr:putative HTH-type transcriptional regulator [Mycobacterium sp.]
MPARDRLIAGAIELMRRNGVAGTGLNQLLDLSKTARRSLYLNFPGGKAELIASATVTSGQLITSTIERLAADVEPVAAVQAFIALWRDTLTRSGFTSGCPVVAAAMGRSEAAEAADIAGEVFTEWEQRLASHLESRDVSPDEASQLATLTIAAIEGAVVMSMATKSDAPMQRAEDALVGLYRQKVGSAG